MAPQSSSRRRRSGKAPPAAPTASAAPAPAGRGPLQWIARQPVELWRTFSGLGLVIGALFFAAALTPSLIPRAPLLQGVLSGVCFAIGYGIGVLLLAAWEWMQLPLANVRVRRNATWAAAAVALAVVLRFLWKSAEWQNSIRERMGMPLLEGAEPFTVALVALVVFVLLLLVARSFRGVGGMVRRWLARYVPERVSMLVGGLAAAALFWTLVDGVLFDGFIRLSDRSFQALDALMEPQFPAPTEPARTGSAESLVSWEELGRAGREFVVSGPTAEQIAAFTGRPAKQPIRVYAGLNSAEELDDRARLVLDEMIRAGAFDRKVLIVVVPTGTGWMDPAAMDTLEYLHDGDTAIVAMQYSYLTSWISLLVEPGYGSAAGRELFRAVYRHWTELPEDARPKLYLQGLSLGSYGSEQSFRVHEVMADPFQGAVWSGPPFPSPLWGGATRERNPGSPEWLPTYGDGSIIRFTNQENHLDVPGAEWGPMRIVFLQYASDPITFFDPHSVWHKPDWMTPPLGPDVSPELRWYPVVTFLQLGLDMAIALAVPIGHGHYYAPEHYIDAWVAVTDPPGWTPEEVGRLKRHFIEARAGG
ncbi:alpha/beta-hydrolase family protein [Amaricoccus sp.]|uniref:alpha/beta hydrolase n=1 Tax=Amaricoccus sp. TaxID=1872485 RepID=UPI00261C7D9F|nr:alpha/beta-hydrolase family protein [Amaricoccus sp.]HRO11883.1 alpha/beta-hydrolase family protein [Amaricoccus sp.]